jgi:L-threonylcarbamoyladenylate synthase
VRLTIAEAAKLAEAARTLRAGGVVAFPTETVYGLGANALDAEAVRRVYELKGRPATSPLIVHVASIEMARGVVREWPVEAEELASRYWPGPLTVVLSKQGCVPDEVTAGLGTVGVRMPAHPVALELIRAAGVPIAAPSANKFMGVSPTTAAHVRAAFGDAVPVIDGGACTVGIESTVVAIVDGEVQLLRPGMIALGDLRMAASVDGEAHAAPGMHRRHYSPRVPLRIVDGVLPEGRGGYVFHTRELDAAQVIRLPRDPAAYAAGLYAALHALDDTGLDDAAGLSWIAVERLPEGAEWAAIADRLQRAAAE